MSKWTTGDKILDTTVDHRDVVTESGEYIAEFSSAFDAKVVASKHNADIDAERAKVARLREALMCAVDFMEKISTDDADHEEWRDQIMKMGMTALISTLTDSEVKLLKIANDYPTLQSTGPDPDCIMLHRLALLHWKYSKADVHFYEITKYGGAVLAETEDAT